MGRDAQNRQRFLKKEEISHMFKKILALSLIIIATPYADYSYASTQINQQELLTVVLMVKNEQDVMESTLDPFVKAGIQSFLIFDTGSTDDTILVTENFFRKNQIKNYVIEQEPFIDFATSRNHALDAAEKHFTQSVFFLMPDAEWYLHNAKGLVDFCIQELDRDIPCYLIRIANESIDFSVPRLIRAKSKARFQGVVHEIIPVSKSVRAPSDIYFELGISRYGMEKSRKRWQRDVTLLLKAHQDDPADPRSSFYLAQTYECLGDLQTAYHYYKLRSGQEGWHEENYETFYRLGRITERLSQIDSNYTWPMAFDYYATAHNLMPHRAEPLVQIAYHYWPDGVGPSNSALCYLFAKRACELAYPENDRLFIDPVAYKFKRYEILSKAAWQVGDFENGEAATRRALQVHEMPHLLNNLAAYVTRRMQAQ